MLKVYYLFDKRANELTNCFISANDESALRVLKNDIYQLTLQKKSLILSQLSDCSLFKYEQIEGKNEYLNVKVLDLKSLISFDLDLQLKSLQKDKIENVKN